MLDFGDVVVHVMSEEKRSYYDMESFYGTAEEVYISFALMLQLLSHLISSAPLERYSGFYLSCTLNLVVLSAALDCIAMCSR